MAGIVKEEALEGADEEGTLAGLKTIRRELSDPKVREHRGRIVKTTGVGRTSPHPLPGVGRTARFLHPDGPRGRRGIAPSDFWLAR